MHIVDVKLKVLALPQPSHFLDGLPELVHRVCDAVHAVAYGSGLPRSRAAALQRLGDGGGSGARCGQTHGQGGLGKLDGVSPDRSGVARQRAEAEVGVLGGGAGSADESEGFR